MLAYRKPTYIRAQLSGAILVGARLQAAKINEAQLQEASLYGVQLQGANLLGAQLQGADLRSAEGVRFNDTNIKDIRVDLRFGKFLERYWNPLFIKKPRAIPWIELRRDYTGINFLLTLVALLVFLFPYVLQTGYLQALNWFQMTLVETTPTVRESIEGVGQSAPLVTYLENLTPCFAQECKGQFILELILGRNQGIEWVILNLSLIFYNVLRFWVTHTVNILRDEEEQGGWSPVKKEVDRLIHQHIVLKSLLLLVFVYGIVRVVVILFTVIQVPA